MHEACCRISAHYSELSELIFQEEDLDHRICPVGFIPLPADSGSGAGPQDASASERLVRELFSVMMDKMEDINQRVVRIERKVDEMQGMTEESD